MPLQDALGSDGDIEYFFVKYKMEPVSRVRGQSQHPFQRDFQQFFFCRLKYETVIRQIRRSEPDR